MKLSIAISAAVVVASTLPLSMPTLADADTIRVLRCSDGTMTTANGNQSNYDACYGINSSIRKISLSSAAAKPLIPLLKVPGSS